MNKQVELIRAEIERKYKEAIEGVKRNQKKQFLDLRSNVNFVICQCLESMLVHLLSFIDSLQGEPVSMHDAGVIKEDEEPTSEDLEEEIEKYLKDSLAVKFPTTNIDCIKADIRYTARHFAAWQNQQMMKKAISGEVKEGLAVGDFGWEDSGWIETDTFCIEKYALKANDKVKLIIVKEG